MFCALFGLSKQAYYKQIKQKQQKSDLYNQAVTLVLRHRGIMPRLGTRKLHHMLNHDNINIGRDKLFDLLRDRNLLVSRKRKYTVTTNSNHWLRKYPSLIKNTIPSRPEQIWVSDITYLNKLEESNLYLHIVTDAYSKKIMGYELSNNLEANSTLRALKRALKNRKYPKSPLIHHSDRGLQYCSQIYTSSLIQNQVQISMTQNGNPYENAVAERVNGILKNEFDIDSQFNTLKEARLLIDQSIWAYNHLRPHLSCNMLTPVQMHKQKKITIKTYNKKAQTFFENA